MVLKNAPRADGQLSIVEVGERFIVLSTGEEILIRYDKARALCETLCQEQAAVVLRACWTFVRDKRGMALELVEVHRVGKEWPDSTQTRPEGNGSLLMPCLVQCVDCGFVRGSQYHPYQTRAELLKMGWQEIFAGGSVYWRCPECVHRLAEHDAAQIRQA